MLKERFKPFTNEGFNYKDRKTTKGGKIWAKDEKVRLDSEKIKHMQEVRHLLREGTLCKNIKMIMQGLELV